MAAYTVVATWADGTDTVAVMSSSGGIFGCAGQDLADLRRTGDGAATLADVRRRTAVRDVIHTLAVAAGVGATAIDARFEEAWPH